MCGVSGFNWSDPARIHAMNTALSHRGPDQDGIYCDDRVSLGHRRLSIIDLSNNGRQPMSNEDGSVQLVFNGEIYNFSKLRQKLQRAGHTFKSNSDSEVIVHAYEEYGLDCLDHLQGMFAIAIWDSVKQCLFLARDRMGIKPLYFYWASGKLIFSSEIKAILEHPEVPRELNQQALYEYLGFEFVPAPLTMFRDIHKLAAGERLVYQNDAIRVETWWDLSMAPAREPLSFQESVERERELIEQSVRSHLVSDVPVGVFLSGGLDSSAITAMMRRQITGQLRTFTIGYEDPSFSELDYAAMVARHLETDHQVLMIETMNQERLEKSLYHLDEPMTDLSAIPLMLVCEEARKQVTVCLSGEGGDESFAGYDRFKASWINDYYSMIPNFVRRGLLSPLVAKLPDQPQKKGAINMLKRFVEGADLPEDGDHLRWQYFSSSEQDAALFKRSFSQGVNMDPFHRIRAYREKCDASDAINRQAYLDMRFFMTDSVLMKVDKMSMASSLEIRVPLLDHTLVEYVAGLPGDWKLNLQRKGLVTKHVFRQALDGLLPDKIVQRPKQGYSLPVKNLLRGDLRDYMITLLNESSIISNTMNRRYIDTLIDDHLSMARNNNHILWALMNVAIWQNRFDINA
jgi:asparagine synthase (glutamine-hydrolysing)